MPFLIVRRFKVTLVTYFICLDHKTDIANDLLRLLYLESYYLELYLVN